MGQHYAVQQHITMQDLLFRANLVIKPEREVTRHQVLRHSLELIDGSASFVRPHQLRVDSVGTLGSQHFTVGRILIAVGTTAHRMSTCHRTQQPFSRATTSWTWRSCQKHWPWLARVWWVRNTRRCS